MRGFDCLMSSPDCPMSEFNERKTEEKRVQAIEAKRCEEETTSNIFTERLCKPRPENYASQIVQARPEEIMQAKARLWP